GEPCARSGRAWVELRWEGGDGAPLGWIVAMRDVEIGVDKGLQLASRRGLLDCRDNLSVDLRRALVEGLDEEILFALEVAVEAAAGEVGLLHEGPPARALAPPAAGDARGGS